MRFLLERLIGFTVRKMLVPRSKPRQRVQVPTELIPALKAERLCYAV